jgi:hypothetical protein
MPARPILLVLCTNKFKNGGSSFVDSPFYLIYQIKLGYAPLEFAKNSKGRCTLPAEDVRVESFAFEILSCRLKILFFMFSACRRQAFLRTREGILAESIVFSKAENRRKSLIFDIFLYSFLDSFLDSFLYWPFAA